jgi:hypothetical protein
MSTEYTGVATYPITITVPDGSDADDAASAAVAIMQLADRCEALRAGHNLVFYDATFHGASYFADGTIAADVEQINLNATVGIGISASEELFLYAGTDFRVQANQNGDIDIFGNLALDVGGNVACNIGGNAVINPSGILNFGGSAVDFMGGLVHFSPAGISLGSSTSNPTEIRGGLTAQHNATFIAGKTVALNGTTTAADLTATALKGTVSNAAGITYSGQGRAHYRDKLLTSADLASPFLLHPDVADFFYVTALTSTGYAKIDTGGSSINGDVIEVSTLGMTGGFNLEIYAADETTLLLTMSATTNSWAKWKRMSTGLWRLIGVSDG